MATLEIYNSEGYEYDPEQTGKRGNRLNEINQLFSNDIRIGIKSQRRKIEAFFWFRARKNKKARREQFYARYITRGNSDILSSLIRDLERRVRSDWGYQIDNRQDIYQTIKNSRTTSPASDTDQKVLEHLAANRQTPTVGVADATAAIGLVQSFFGQESFDNIAIADRNPGSVANWDMVVVPDKQTQSGITPLGETANRWEQSKSAVRKQAIQSEIDSIRESVTRLSTEHGLSDNEIRTRVQQNVPTLNNSSDGRRVSIPDTDNGQHTLTNIAVPTALIILLVGGIAATIVLGIGPLGDLALFSSDTEDPDFTVEESEDKVELDILHSNDTDRNDSITIVHHENGTETTANKTGPFNETEIFDGDLSPGEYRTEIDGDFEVDQIRVLGILDEVTHSYGSDTSLVNFGISGSANSNTTVNVTVENETRIIEEDSIELDEGEINDERFPDDPISAADDNITATVKGDRTVTDNIEITDHDP